MGHFKEKFGFRRERVPFVLTHDFVYVINNGNTDKETEEFKKFKDLCETVSTNFLKTMSKSYVNVFSENILIKNLSQPMSSYP